MLNSIAVIYIRCNGGNWKLLCGFSPSMPYDTKMAVKATITQCGYGYQELVLSLDQIEPELTEDGMQALIEQEDFPF